MVYGLSPWHACGVKIKLIDGIVVCYNETDHDLDREPVIMKLVRVMEMA